MIEWINTISIHAPREGSDIIVKGSPSVFFYFYPRSPRGERQNAQALAINA